MFLLSSPGQKFSNDTENQRHNSTTIHINWTDHLKREKHIHKISLLAKAFRITTSRNNCWFSIGPPSTTMDQRQTNIEPTSCVCCVCLPDCLSNFSAVQEVVPVMSMVRHVFHSPPW